GEALRLQLGQRLQALSRREVEVAPARGRDVAGDALAAPMEVVGRDEVDEHAEAELVARLLAGLADARRLDRDGRFTERFLLVDEAGQVAVLHVATCLSVPGCHMSDLMWQPGAARPPAVRRPDAPRGAG